jgi:hypothetical protein
MCGVAFGQDVGTGRGGRGAGAQKGRWINRGEPNGSFRWGARGVDARTFRPDAARRVWIRLRARGLERMRTLLKSSVSRSPRVGDARPDAGSLISPEMTPPLSAPKLESASLRPTPLALCLGGVLDRSNAACAVDAGVDARAHPSSRPGM